MSGPATLHATAVMIGEKGVLIRGLSGAGKSSLAALLIEKARAEGYFARLLGDDRVIVAVANGRLIARPHPLIAGQIERRGMGIVAKTHENAGCIHLIVDLSDAAPRLPTPDQTANVMGVTLPLLALGGIANPESLLFMALTQKK